VQIASRNLGDDEARNGYTPIICISIAFFKMITVSVSSGLI